MFSFGVHGSASVSANDSNTVRLPSAEVAGEKLSLSPGAPTELREIIVVRPLPGEADLTCGGHPVVDLKETPAAGLSLKEGADTGNALGKRYTDASGTLELLVTKPGAGTLALGGDPLVLKEAKPLPASD